MKKIFYTLSSFFLLSPIFIYASNEPNACPTLNGGTITRSPGPRSYCSGDGVADIVNISVTNVIGTNFKLMFNDANGKILEILDGTTYNFEGKPSNVFLVRGISYENGLTGLVVGGSINNLVGCYALSTTGFDITTFNKEAGSISLQNGSTSTSICVSDGIADIFPITFTGFDAFGAMWAVTDLSGKIIRQDFNVPNFEGTGSGVVKLVLLTSCFETFVIANGTNINQLPMHMDVSNAITVTKNIGCAPIVVCAPEVKACPGKVLMCVNGVSTCVDSKQVNKMLKQGAKQGGCIVCKNTANNGSRSFKTTLPERRSEINETNVYPNPSNGSFKIQTTFKGNSKYEISSSAGKILWSKNFNRSANDIIDIDLKNSGLKPGIYLLRITNNDGMQIKRVIIN